MYGREDEWYKPRRVVGLEFSAHMYEGPAFAELNTSYQRGPWVFLASLTQGAVSRMLYRTCSREEVGMFRDVCLGLGSDVESTPAAVKMLQ